MQEMLYPTSYLKSKGLGKECALITDGRFSGGTSGLSIGHCSPKRASGGGLALVENGDMVEIDIPNRTLNVKLSDDELDARRGPQWRRVSVRINHLIASAKYPLLCAHLRCWRPVPIRVLCVIQVR